MSWNKLGPAAAIGIVLASTFALASNSPVITGAQLKRRGEAVELHFKITGRSRWRLSSHGSQLWIDLDRVYVQLPPRPLFGYETPPISSVRTINLATGSRLLIEVNQKTDYAIAALPGELLVRLAPEGKIPDLTALKNARPASTVKSERAKSERADHSPTRAPDLSAPAVRPASIAPSERLALASPSMGEKPRGPVRVVIDPGHGGKDPGTEASEAAPEKLIALQIAERLAAALSRNGIQTALTRDDDYFLSLAQRTQFANREGADLFVSIHLNSSPNPETNGLEVYYLNNTTDRATIRLARMENALAAEDGAEPEPNLNYILSDLRQQYKATESAMLAQMIEEQTVSELQSSFGSEIRGLGAKKGPFYVLVGAHMPAVLVECGFLSNEEEARRLTSERYQDGLADGIATALLRYLNADVAAGTL